MFVNLGVYTNMVTGPAIVEITPMSPTFSLQV